MIKYTLKGERVKMIIHCIIEEVAGTFTGYSPAAKSLLEVQQTSAEKTNFLIVENEDAGIITLNLSAILRCEALILNVTGWTALIPLLTDIVITTYQTQTVIPRYFIDLVQAQQVVKINTLLNSQQSSPIYHSCDNMFGIKIDYTSQGLLSWINRKVLKYKLNDLFFSHEIPAHPVLNFNNTLPSINGIIHFPQVVNDQLQVKDGVKAICQTFSTNKNIVLTDFSPVGNITCIPMADCVKRTSVYHKDIIVKLPANASLVNKYLMVVVAGRLFFDYELKKITEKSFRLNIGRQLLANIILTNKIIRNEFNPGTGIVNDNDLDTYLNTTMWTASDCFVVLLDNENMKINQIPMLMRYTDDKFKFPRHSFGLLIKSATREIIDYTHIRYNTSMDVMISPPYPNKIVWNQNTNDLSHYTNITNTRNTPWSSYTDTAESKYVIYDLIG